MNSDIQYVDIQDGGVFNAVTRVVNHLLTKCGTPHNKIAEYLNILNDNADTIVTVEDIDNIYDFYITVTKALISDIGRINQKITNLKTVNEMIKNKLGDKSKINEIPEELFMNEDIDAGRRDYQTLCQLATNYYEFIKPLFLNDDTIISLCKMNLKTNFITPNLNLNLDLNFKKVLEKFRLGIPDSNNLIRKFLNDFSLYIESLNQQLDGSELHYKLSRIAEAFNQDIIQNNSKPILTRYIDKIIDYIKVVKDESNDTFDFIEVTKTALKNIFFGDPDTEDTTRLVYKYFNIIEIDRSKSGPNKFFTLYNHSDYHSNINNYDLLKTSIKFYKYVNVFRTIAIPEIDTYTEILKLYNQKVHNPEDNDYVLYNKSLNNWVIKRSKQNINFTNFTYEELFKLLIIIDQNEEYLNFDTMAKTIIDNLKKKNLKLEDLNFLKTNKVVLFDLIDPSLLDPCVILNIKDKTLSGIKIFLYMYQCAKDKIYYENIENVYKPIHIYLNLNTNEKKSHKLVKESKLKTILKKLIDSKVTLSDAKTLQKIYLKKKIRNSILETKINQLVNELTSLTSNPAKIVKLAKYVYNLLIALSPESIDWNLLNFITGYFQSKFGIGTAITGIKQYFGSKDTIFSIKDFEQYVIDQQTKKVPKWDLDTFKIYSYFNFDALIVNRETLKKILDELKSNEGISEKQFETLTKIFNAHKESLKLVNKEPSSKLDYFVEKMDLFIYVGSKKPGVNKVLSNRLYKILLEVSNQNIYTLNIVDFLKEQGITTFTEDDNKGITDLIVDMFEIYEFKHFRTRNEEEQDKENADLKGILDKMSEGTLDNTDNTDKAKLTKLIEQIKASPEYISQAESIKIFFARLTDTSNSENQAQEIIENYDLQQELYQILGELAKTSTVITETTNIITEQVQDAITKEVNTRIQALKLQMGFTSVNEDEVKQVGEIISTAKTVAVTAGTAFATLGAYKAVDAIFGVTSDSGSSNSSLLSYKDASLKSEIQALIVGVGTTLTLSSAQSLYPKILSIVQSYIGLESNKLGLPIPDLNYSVLGGIIMAGLTLGIQGQLKNTIFGGSQTTLTDKPKSKSLIELVLDWIFNSIDKLFGFNGVKPEIPPSLDPENIDRGSQINRIESAYLYLTSQRLGTDDIFDGAIINEHPDQQKVLQDLTTKYNEFNSLNFEFNPYFTLKKQDKKKIKKIIAKIVALELNLFKSSNPYTFVYALNKFLGTEKNL